MANKQSSICCSWISHTSCPIAFPLLFLLGAPTTTIAQVAQKSDLVGNNYAKGIVRLDQSGAVAPSQPTRQRPRFQGKATLAWHSLISNKDYQPFYHLYGIGGTMGDHRFNARLAGAYHARYRLDKAKKWHLTGGSALWIGYPKLYRIQNLYTTIQYKNVAFGAGRMPRQNHQPTPLTTPAIGDMGLSNNATPIPKIGLYSTDFIPVPIPFIQRYLSLHAGIYHGWMEARRHIKSPYWHEKYLHGRLQIGHSPPYVQLLCGLKHYAMWSGFKNGSRVHPLTPYTYWRMFRGAHTPEESNGTGNHLGVWNMGINLHLNKHKWRLFAQKVFDGRYRDHNALYKQDGLIGLRYTPARNDVRFAMEYNLLRTLWQAGEGIPDPTSKYPTIAANNGLPFGGRANLYNNYLYQNGYSYLGFLIGNSLPITYARARMLRLGLREGGEYDEHFVASNRIVAHHLSVSVSPQRRTHLWVQVTRAAHHGTYYGRYQGRYEWNGIHTDPHFQYRFIPPQIQWHTQLKAAYQAFKHIDLVLSCAWDNGDLYSAFGLHTSLTYRIE